MCRLTFFLFSRPRRNLLICVKINYGKKVSGIRPKQKFFQKKEEGKLLDKNKWLNLVLGIFSFYTVFSVMEILMGRYGTKVVSVTPATSNISVDLYYLISYVIALVLSLSLIIIFCKPRGPWFVFFGILLGGCLAMFHTLYTTVINLDKYLRQQGILAVQYLLPHLVVIIGALIALYIAWLSNKMGSSGGTAV
jgi:hypothetical protein